MDGVCEKVGAAAHAAEDDPGRAVEVLNYLPPRVRSWEERATYADWKRRGKRGWE
jgi:hypothetical protein